jgi:hypothetical protein
LPLLVFIIPVVLILLLIFVYLNARARFVLMQSAVERDCRLGEMWERWRTSANRYFRFVLLFALVQFALFAAGGFQVFQTIRHGGHFSSLFGLFTLGGLLMLAAAVIWLFTKDFLVPIMAYEGRDVGEAWERLRGIMSAEPTEFVLYVIARVLLSVVATAVAMAIITGVVLVLAIPLGITVAFGVVLAKSAGILAIALAVMAVLVLVPLLALAVLLFSAPFGVFWESFALEFLAGRVPPLAAAMYRVAPLPTPPPAPVIPTPQPSGA